MTSKMLFALMVGAAAFAAGPAAAGEITGTGEFLGMHGNSACSFSGLNDTPDGEPGVDPGGRVQSYGFFLAHGDWLSPFLDPAINDPREPSLSPGWSCNPNRGGDFTPPE